MGKAMLAIIIVECQKWSRSYPQQHLEVQYCVCHNAQAYLFMCIETTMSHKGSLIDTFRHVKHECDNHLLYTCTKHYSILELTGNPEMDNSMEKSTGGLAMLVAEMAEITRSGPQMSRTSTEMKPPPIASLTRKLEGWPRLRGDSCNYIHRHTYNRQCK